MRNKSQKITEKLLNVLIFAECAIEQTAASRISLNSIRDEEERKKILNNIGEVSETR